MYNYYYVLFIVTIEEEIKFFNLSATIEDYIPTTLPYNYCLRQRREVLSQCFRFVRIFVDWFNFAHRVVSQQVHITCYLSFVERTHAFAQSITYRVHTSPGLVSVID